MIPTSRPDSRPTRRLAALMATLALIGAACGGDNGVGDTSLPPTTEAPTTLPPTTAPTDGTTTTVDETPTTEPAPGGRAELVWSLQHESKIEYLAVSPDGTYVVVAQMGAFLHHVADGRLVDVFAYQHYPGQVNFSPDGEIIGAGLGVYGVALTDLRGNVPEGLEDLAYPPQYSGARLGGGFDNRLAFSPDGQHVATGNREGVIWVWRLEDGQQVASFEDPGPDDRAFLGETVSGLTYHPSGRLLAAIHFDCMVNVWDLEAGEVLHALQLGDSSCHARANLLVFAPDGATMAGAVVENWVQFVRVWDVETAAVVVDFPIDVRNFADLSFSPDGSMLATAAWRLPPTVWDPVSATVLYSLDSGIDPDEGEGWYHPTAISFTPDGGHVLVGYHNGTLELWRLPGAAALVAPEAPACEPLPLPGDVLFETGSSALRASADDVLEALAADLAEGFPVATLTFVGHTDSRGTASANMTLSVARAEAVRDWFAAWAQDAGLAGWTLLVDGKGDTELKVVDTDPDGGFVAAAGALNRRVEIDIAAETCD